MPKPFEIKEEELWESLWRSLECDDVKVGVRILGKIQQHKDQQDRSKQKYLM